MAKITPVPNGHLIKKDGTSLKNGGKIDAFSKMRKSIDNSIKGKGNRDKQSKNWMDRQKKRLSKIQTNKKK